MMLFQSNSTMSAFSEQHKRKVAVRVLIEMKLRSVSNNHR